jgi:hypothetical protein
MLPHAWVALLGLQAGQFFSIQTFFAFGLIVLLLLAIYAVAKTRNVDRKTWVGPLAGIVAGGIAAMVWVPQWSAYVVAIGFVLFVFAPGVLRRLALRRSAAGYQRAATLYAHLACVLHPSRQMRFELSFLRAQSLGSTQEKIAAYRALALHSTPEQSALLNCRISMAQDDWEGVLSQFCSAADKMPDLKAFGVRALGELGRVNEMIATYASAESGLSPDNLLFSRLFVLAFSGYIDGVRCLLSRKLRFLKSRDKAYWILIASHAAGTTDEEARRALASYACTADDERFRGMAERLLDAAPRPAGPALSEESRATIAAIEKAL